MFPTLLSETGLFSPNDLSRPAPGLIPYSVNAPAWNDGAKAQRWMAIPGNARPTYKADSGWEFPDKTALVQTLSLEAEIGKPESSFRVETRVQLRQQGEWDRVFLSLEQKSYTGSTVHKGRGIGRVLHPW